MERNTLISNHLSIYLAQELGVYGTFTNVDEYCLDLIPFDHDVLSMEIESAYRVSDTSCY